MNPRVQFDVISAALDLPQHNGTVSAYVKKDNDLIISDSADVNDVLILDTLKTLRTVLEDSAEAATANSNPESFTATANIARTIFMGIKMLKDSTPKKAGKVVNNHLHVNSFDDVIAARKLT